MVSHVIVLCLQILCVGVGLYNTNEFRQPTNELYTQKQTADLHDYNIYMQHSAVLSGKCRYDCRKSITHISTTSQSDGFGPK